MSICSILNFLCVANAVNILKESCFKVGENVSLKSIPYFCVKPRATRRAFLLNIFPSESFLYLNIHFDDIILVLFGKLFTEVYGSIYL